MNELWLAFEGGGTKTRILLAEPGGVVQAREVGGPASPLYITQLRYAREIRGLLKRIRQTADRLGGHVTTAGLAAPMKSDLVQEAIREVFGPVEFVLAGECEIALALFDLDWGVSLVAGTGASCRAQTPDGRGVSHGGFGPQFGDEGSGYWIGRSAISAAMRASDGRGPATVLAQAVCETYGIARVYDVLRFIDRSGHVPGPRVAAMTPRVFEAARQGDAVARGICREAGYELGKLVVMTAKGLPFPNQPIPLVMTGGVFHGGGLILLHLRGVLNKSRMRFDVHPPVAEPAEGIFRVMQQIREGKRHVSGPILRGDGQDSRTNSGHAARGHREGRRGHRQ